MESFPLVPMEEDGRLHDAALRESFIDRIFVFKRWRETLAKGKRMGNLVDFHTRHKLLILAHSPQHHRMMGRLVAKGKDTPSNKLYADYFALLMEALKRKTTVKKNTNVLHHLMGYFKKQLSRDEKEELLEVIGLYHQGFVPLVVPTTLISHYVTKYDEPCLRQQVYLDPHPVELRLRNHV